MGFYLYQDKNTIIHRLDPRVKILVLMASFILTLFYQHPLQIMFVAGFILIYGVMGKALDNLKKVWFLILVIAIFATVTWSFFAKGKTPWWNGVSFESFLYGVGSAMKINLMIVAGVIFVSTCRNEEVTIGLIKLGIPYVLSFAFAVALRLVPTFLETGATVVEAQKSRGVNLDEKNIRNKFHNYFALLGPIFLTTIRQAASLAMALESKGFAYSHKRSFYVNLRLKKIDYLIVVVTLVILLINIYLVYKGFGKINGLIL